MTSRPGQAESRKRALIGAALLEISARGSLDVTVAQIARRAGVSSALAHHYFGAKEDLILATMRHLLAEFGALVVAALRRAGDPRSRLAAIVRASFGPEQFHHATIAAWLTFYTKALSSKGAARLLLIYQRRLHSNLVHALRASGASSPEREAEAIAALIDGLYLREALKPGPSDPHAAIRLIEAHIDRALAAPQ
ncbi:transcriptional regulator BetI [soil metagenome]